MERTGGHGEYAFIADLYDHVVPYSQRQDVAFCVEAAQAAGGPILEVGCGTGRVLIPTARIGVDIVGLDASPHVLAVCRDTLRQEPGEVQARVRLLEADRRYGILVPILRLPSWGRV